MNWLERRLQFYFQSNDDSGTQSWENMPAGIQRAIARANAEVDNEDDENEDNDSAAVEEDADEEEKDESSEEGQDLIFGKFKTLEEAEAAHKELEARFHADNQRVDDDEEEDEDPFAEIRQLQLRGFKTQEPSNWEELAALMQEDAKGAAKFMLENADAFEPQQVQFVVNKWAQEDPHGHGQWLIANALSAFGQQITQRIAPVEARNQTEVVTQAWNQIQKFPEFEKYHPLMQEVLQANPELVTEQHMEKVETIVGLIRDYIDSLLVLVLSAVFSLTLPRRKRKTGTRRLPRWR